MVKSKFCVSCSFRFSTIQCLVVCFHQEGAPTGVENMNNTHSPVCRHVNDAELERPWPGQKLRTPTFWPRAFKGLLLVLRGMLWEMVDIGRCRSGWCSEEW